MLQWSEIFGLFNCNIDEIHFNLFDGGDGNCESAYNGSQLVSTIMHYCLLFKNIDK